MSKYSLVLLSLFLFALMSCKSENEILQIDYNTKPFNIKIGAAGINSHYKYVVYNKNGESVLHYYDWMRKRITLINFDDKKIVGHLPFNDAKYPINGLYHMVKTDSNYHAIRNIDYFYWLAPNGDVDYFKDGKSFDGIFSEKGQYRPVDIENSNSDNMNFHVVSRKANHDLDFLRTLQFAHYDFVDEKVDLLPIEVFGAEYVGKNQTLAYKSDPFLLSINNINIVHYPFTADLQIINSETKKSKIIKFSDVKASIPDMEPITSAELERAVNSMRIKKLDEPISYYPLIYDEFRKLYYRPYMLARDLDVEKNANYSLNLLVFNRQFDLLGQLKLGNKYMPFLYITDDAVYIRKKEQRESYIEMDELLFEVE